MKFSLEKCPYCYKVLNFKTEGGAGTVDSKIGRPGFFTCHHCGGRISNGKEEWVDLDWVDRSIHIIRIIFTIAFWAFGCGVGLAILGDKVFDSDPAVWGVAGAIAVVVLISWGAINEVKESVERSTAAKESSN